MYASYLAWGLLLVAVCVCVGGGGQVKREMEFRKKQYKNLQPTKTQIIYPNGPSEGIFREKSRKLNQDMRFKGNNPPHLPPPGLVSSAQIHCAKKEHIPGTYLIAFTWSIYF